MCLIHHYEILNSITESLSRQMPRQMHEAFDYRLLLRSFQCLDNAVYITILDRFIGDSVNDDIE